MYVSVCVCVILRWFGLLSACHTVVGGRLGCVLTAFESTTFLGGNDY